MDAELTQTLKDMARSMGPCLTGIATVDTLRGGPPSADLTYVLPGARSAVCFPIPENDEDFQPAILNALGPFLQRPREGTGFHHFLIPGNRLEFTCGHCQIICHPDKAVRARRYKMLTQSGVVVQNPDGSREAVTPEEAKRHLAEMPPETRALYEQVPAPAQTTA